MTQGRHEQWWRLCPAHGRGAKRTRMGTEIQSVLHSLSPGALGSGHPPKWGEGAFF